MDRQFSRQPDGSAGTWRGTASGPPHAAAPQQAYPETQQPYPEQPYYQVPADEFGSRVEPPQRPDAGYPPAAPPRRKKRRGRKWIALLIVLVVLAGLVVLADRIAANVAGDKIGDLIADEAADYGVTSDRPPEVSISGFPFLTQVISGEYDEVTVELRDIRSEEGLTLSQLDIRAIDVSADLSDVINGDGPITAARMAADGRITYESLTSVVEAEVSDIAVESLGGGELSMRATMEVAEQSFTVVGTATVQHTGNALSIVPGQFNVENGEVPMGGQEAFDSFVASLNTTIELPELPYDLSLDDVSVESDAIHVTGSASDVPLA